MTQVPKSWFEEWFDTPYYHLLYKHRDTVEASLFIDNLLAFLNPPPAASFLDLACGRGRHAIYLAEKGYQVTGLDLSVQNIAYASRFSHPKLDFHVHDMREVFRPEAFDYIFNLFTSFGYFENREENQAVIHSIAAMLKPGGKVVIDFINAAHIGFEATTREEEIEGISFYIRKQRTKDRVIKNIEVRDEGHSLQYSEMVRLFSLEDFEEFFTKAGLTLKTLFGDYQLHNFAAQSSERLILVGEKR